jgi:DNA-binding MurR/RpiR family transcriptional regulator
MLQQPTAPHRAAGAPRGAPLIQRIRDEMPQLSRQLKAIARYVLQHADYLVLERIQDVAERCGTQPSAVVRFAKHFGFHGFQELKQAFSDDFRRHRLGQRPDVRERLRPRLEARPDGDAERAPHAGTDDTHGPDGTEIAFDVIDGACAGVKQLQRQIRAEDLRHALGGLARARTLWVVGVRRAYPVASYLAYALQSLDKPVQWVDLAGGMQDGQLRGLRPDDALIAISFAPWAEETLHAARVARTLGASVIALTDTADSPLARIATVSLNVPESSTQGFRALTNAVTVAQALFVGLAFRLEGAGRAEPA